MLLNLASNPAFTPGLLQSAAAAVKRQVLPFLPPPYRTARTGLTGYRESFDRTGDLVSAGCPNWQSFTVMVVTVLRNVTAAFDCC